MANKKFTQDIADILAEDLAMLESIEPGAILRPDRAPGPEPPADAAAASQVVSVVPLAEAPAGDDQPSLPLTEDSGVDQPDLFTPAPGVTATPPQWTPPVAGPGRQVAAAAEMAPAATPEIAPAAAPEIAPAVGVQTAAPTVARMEARTEAKTDVQVAATSHVAAPDPEPVARANSPTTDPVPAEPTAPVVATPEAAQSRPARAAASRRRKAASEPPARATEPPVGASGRPTASNTGGNPGQDPPAGPHGSSRPARAGDGEQHYTDAVTLLEIAPPDEGGVRERALPGDRSQSPPSPPEGRRGWNHPVARWTTYILVVVALTFIFLVLLIDIFHLG